MCHFQEILGEPQVKSSKHLAYLRDRDLPTVERHQNWMIYSLPKKLTAELTSNLKCLQDCVQSNPVFKSDLRKLRGMKKDLCWIEEVCCASGRKKTHK